MGNAHTMSLSRSALERSAGLLLAFMLVLSGCDTAAPGTDSVFLTFEVGGNGARFAFQGDGIQTGRLVDLDCGCSYSVSDFLADQGFSTSEIVSATLQEATVRTVFPIGAPLTYLNTVILKLDAPGLSTIEIAESTVLPATEQTSLTVRPNRDIASYLDRASFQPILQIDAASLDSGESYDLAVRFSIRIEVEGI
jgi:hypothetical protein